MDLHLLRARTAAEAVGLTEGATVAAVRWDGSDSGADEIIDWVTGAGGGAGRSADHIVVSDGGDVAFASASSWIAHVPSGHMTFGPEAAAHLFELADESAPVPA